MIRAGVLIAAAAALAACTDLTTLGVCGNGVVEHNIGEDCDGDSEACVACRLVCEPTADHPDATCPSGFACGKDAICRQPSGYFALPPRLVDVPGDSLAVADFDYDGYADLLGFGDRGVGVVYGSEQLDLARDDTFPAPAPVHVDSQVAILRAGVGEDLPVHDLFIGAAIPVRIGIAAMIDTAGQLLAIPVPGLFVTVDTVDLQTVALFDQIILLVGQLPGTGTTYLAPLADDLDVLEPCGESVPQLALPPAVGHGALSGDVLAVAPRPNEICAYDLYSIQSGLGIPPVPVGVTGSVTDMVFAERAGDACPDLIVKKTDASTWLIAGVDTGAPDHRCTYPSEVALGAFPNQRVLAVGRQDADAIDDLLLQTMVLRNAGDKLLLTGLSYTTGAIVDVNGDGLGDLVLGSDSHPDLDVLIQLAPDVYSHDIARTAQPTAMVRTADFDGDTFPDVVIIGAPQPGQDGVVPDADIAILYGGPQGLTDPIAIAKVPDPTAAAAEPLLINANVAALVTVNDDFTAAGGSGRPTFSLFLGDTNRGIGSVSVLAGSEARTVTAGPVDDTGRPALWDFAPVMQPVPSGQAECGPGITDPCISGGWLHPGVSAQLTATDVVNFLDGFDPVTSPTPWAVYATIGGVPTAVLIRRDFPGGPAAASQLMLIPAPTSPAILLPGTERDVLPDVPDRTKIVGFRAIELDGDPDSELLIIAKEDERRVPYLVSDPASAALAVDLTSGEAYDCADGQVITGPDGGPLLVLACTTNGHSGLYAVATAEAPPRLERIGELDHIGGVEAGDVNGDGLVDLVVHDERVDDRAAGVAVQCSHYNTAPCTGDQRAPFAFGSGDAP